MVYTGSIIAKEVVKTKTGFPIKLYHSKSTRLSFPDFGSVSQYLLQLLAEYPEITSEPHLYAIAWVFGYVKENKPGQGCDLKSYKFEKSWQECNPGVDSWTFRGHTFSYTPENRETECETGQIVFGKEGELRRTTKSLEEFLAGWPEFRDLE